LEIGGAHLFPEVLELDETKFFTKNAQFMIHRRGVTFGDETPGNSATPFEIRFGGFDSETSARTKFVIPRS
jgi:hypothetical protein